MRSESAIYLLSTHKAAIKRIKTYRNTKNTLSSLCVHPISNEGYTRKGRRPLRHAALPKITDKYHKNEALVVV